MGDVDHDRYPRPRGRGLRSRGGCDLAGMAEEWRPMMQPCERGTLELVQTTLEAAANALAPAFVTCEPTTLEALHAAITEFAAARCIVQIRLGELQNSG